MIAGLTCGNALIDLPSVHEACPTDTGLAQFGTGAPAALSFPSSTTGAQSIRSACIRLAASLIVASGDRTSTGADMTHSTAMVSLQGILCHLPGISGESKSRSDRIAINFPFSRTGR